MTNLLKRFPRGSDATEKPAPVNPVAVDLGPFFLDFDGVDQGQGIGCAFSRFGGGDREAGDVVRIHV